ncbi:rhodanese-related sulfurtransferase [bacterium]|nr:MAG: rhodanese-related sulfurtransferase [bacterium]
MSELRNLISQAELKERLAADPTPRQTISFYKYHPVADPKEFRDALYTQFEKLGVLGRIYVANEGINAQLSVPTANFEAFKTYLDSFEFLRGIRLNMAAEDDGKSFWVLNVKVRPKIVADGIDDPEFSVERVGQYLKAQEFNELTSQPDTVVVDMRNYYEYEIGHFEGALEVPSDTFRQQLPMAAELLDEDKDKNIIMYCTGGIRCEKASAYLMYRGFEKVYHLEGGILEYVRQVREQNLENKFKGKNFVFDGRRSERIGDEIISHCHQCGELSDTHRNCANTDCHLLFLQCDKCMAEFEGCCCVECRDWKNLPAEEKEGRVFSHGEEFSHSQVRRHARFFDIKSE